MKKALLILHQKSSSPGDIGDKLIKRGYKLDIIKTCVGDKLPNNLDDHSLVVIFGGPMSINDSDNQFISIDIDNIGMITSTGYNNVDWRRIFEVTTDINQSQTIQNLQAGSPLYVTKNGVKTIYYPKSNGGWNDIPITNLTISPSKYSINGNYVSSTSGSFYIETTPLHDAGDTINLSFNINTSGNHKFTPGKTYIFCADDTPY